MPTLARLLALNITLVLVVLVAAPVAQAAVLPLEHGAVSFSDTPNDGVVAAGDVLSITETLHNAGVSTLNGLTATLTSPTPGVTVMQGSTAYPPIAAGASAANTTLLQVQLESSLPCGTTVELTLDVTSSDGIATVPFTIATGSQGDFEDHAGSHATIGNSIASLHPVLAMASYAGTATVSTPGIIGEVEVDIGSLTHEDISHVALALRAPGGAIVPLVNAGLGGPGQSFTNTALVADPTAMSLSAPTATAPYTGRFRADGNLGALAGTDQQGSWQLLATEPDPSEIGQIHSWTLRIAPVSCVPRSVARLTATPNPVDPNAPVTLDASRSGTLDPGGITHYDWDLGDGSWLLDGPASRTASFPRGRHTVQVRVSDVHGIVGTASVEVLASYLPIAVVDAPPTPKEQTFVVLDGSDSTDPDGDPIVSYDWEVDGDNDFNDYSGAHPSVYLAAPGDHQIKLRVTDVDGARGEATTTLHVAATTPPSPSIVATPNPVVAGEPVTFDASASTDDGSIVSYEWDLDGDGSYETAGGTSPLATRSYLNATVISIGVRVTDNDTRSAVARTALVVRAPATGPGAGSPFDPGTPVPGGSGDTGGAAGTGGTGGTGGGGSAGGSAGAGAGRLDAGLDGAAIQTLKLVTRKGLGLRCTTDRAATCTVSATLAPADARRLGLSRSRTRPYVLGRATVKLEKAGASAVTVRVAPRALARLKRTPRVTVLVTGAAVDGDGRHVALRRAILIRR